MRASGQDVQLCSSNARDRTWYVRRETQHTEEWTVPQGPGAQSTRNACIAGNETIPVGGKKMASLTMEGGGSKWFEPAPNI